ncbi:MAG: hypothetical protein LBO77_07775 [Desulfovibrio sp.]|nr:hypothetical protein [Desulfovibrio sp.]
MPIEKTLVVIKIKKCSSEPEQQFWNKTKISACKIMRGQSIEGIYGVLLFREIEENFPERFRVYEPVKAESGKNPAQTAGKGGQQASGGISAPQEKGGCLEISRYGNGVDFHAQRTQQGGAEKTAVRRRADAAGNKQKSQGIGTAFIRAAYKRFQQQAEQDAEQGETSVRGKFPGRESPGHGGAQHAGQIEEVEYGLVPAANIRDKSGQAGMNVAEIADVGGNAEDSIRGAVIVGQVPGIACRPDIIHLRGAVYAEQEGVAQDRGRQGAQQQPVFPPRLRAREPFPHSSFSSAM